MNKGYVFLVVFLLILVFLMQLSFNVSATPITNKTTVETFSGTEGTGHTINLPSAVTNDVRVCVIAGNPDGTGTLGTMTIPTGWTEIGTQTETGAASTGMLTIIYRIFQGGDASTLGLTYNNPVMVSSICTTYSGVDTDNPIDQTTPAFATGTGNCVSPTITTQTDNAWVGRACLNDGAPAGFGDTSIPTGTTLRGTEVHNPPSNGQNIGFADEIQITSGSAGTATWSNGASEEYVAATFALREVQQETPTTPTNITCDEGNCNNTFSNNVTLNCSGSTDADGDNITYFLEACYEGGLIINDTNFSLLGAPTQGVGTIIQEGTAEGVTAAIGGTALSFNYDLQQPTGNDRLLVVQVVWEDAETTTISDLTYDGVDMTEAVSVTVGAGFSGFTSIYYLNDSSLPSTAGAYNLSVVTDDVVTNNIYMSVIEYSGVDQTIPDDTDSAVNSAAGDISVTLTADTNNSMLIVAGMTGGTTTMNGAESGDITNVQWQDLTSSGGAIGVTNLTLAPGDYSGGWTGLGTREAAVGAIWHAKPIESASNETNTSYTTYNDVWGACEVPNNVTITVEVDSYNPGASVEQSTSYPDLELEIWNSTDWIVIGEFDLNESYTGSSLNTTNANFSLTTSDSSIMNAWTTVANQDFRIRGKYFDTMNDSVKDEVNWTSVSIDMGGKAWNEIGNHSEITDFSWNISTLDDQSDVDLRCRAIDIDGTNTYSDYFILGSNLTILNTIVSDTCIYSGSGNWNVLCSDNCSISSDIDLLGNNISITGTGTFTTTANITNFDNLLVEGTDSSNRCEVFCLNGGCFQS